MSINLFNMVDNPFAPNASFNYDKFAGAVDLGIKALDEILDYGKESQPLEENKKCIDDWRSVGLGIFGLGDALIALGVRYGSADAIKTVSNITHDMMQQALETSCELAKEKGTFGKYNWDYIKESPIIAHFPKTREKIEKYGLRNASLLSFAPTGSIATMAEMSGGAEPLFALFYDRTTHALEKEGKFFKVFAKSIVGLCKYHNIDINTVTEKELKERFPFVVSAHDINPIDRVKMQAAMQDYIDNSISSTVNMHNSATVEDIFNTYIEAWKNGCKGLTIFRDGCDRTPILVKEKKEEQKQHGLWGHIKPNSVTPIKRKNLPENVEFDAQNDTRHTACVRNMHGFTTTLDGNLFEVFTFNTGGCSSNISTITRLCSLVLRLGGTHEELDAVLRDTNCAACMELIKQGRTDISKSCGNAIADIIATNLKKISKPLQEKDTSEYLECPNCGQKGFRPEGKCGQCYKCNWSRCE
jgi:ribonucleoside-diphosphate reductase alpha chain